MKRFQRLGYVAAAAWLALGLFAGPRAGAQQHRATHLGNPATRFAPPLQKPEDLRRLLQDPALRADVESVLRQAGWKGRPEDLREAAATAEIVPLRLPKGSRMPFMSTRRNGKAIALIDVVWAGKEPIEAYAFEFKSAGRIYRCITPKPCSNFFVVDLGPVPLPALELSKAQPSEVTVCEAFEVALTVANRGKAAATGVVVSDALPEGWRLAEATASTRFEAGTLEPGRSQTYRFRVVAPSSGTYTNRAFATTSDRSGAEATAVTIVRAPALSLACTTPAEAQAGRPIEVCLTATNSGNAAEPKATLSLPIPPGAVLTSATEGGTAVDGRVVWEFASLAPQAARQACAVFGAREPGSWDFTATLSGVCARPVESRCAAKVAGIPAILLEVVDLEDPIEVGNPVTYEIKVVNQGNGMLTRIRLLGALPENQEYVSGSGATAVRAEGRTVSTEVLAELAPKAEAVWRVTAKALAPGDTRFKIDLTADQFPRAVEEYEATSQY